MGNNGIGVTGVSWNVQIMALKFLDAGRLRLDVGRHHLHQLHDLHEKPAGGSTSSPRTIVWGGGGFDQSLYDAIKASNDAGIMFVAAAGNYTGNDDTTPSYPGQLRSARDHLRGGHRPLRQPAELLELWPDLGRPGCPRFGNSQHHAGAIPTPSGAAPRWLRRMSPAQSHC